MTPDPVARLLLVLSVVLLTAILIWGIIASSQRPTIDDRLQRIECLLLVPVEERTTLDCVQLP